ncbi:hypothetical protein NMY22_g12414 [Coprinellus aureogranulatus]|nr:hypothetical protein NMY22_g12414 [Coprinellus aureogranulatus]
MEELALAAPAPAHRLFDVRTVILGRWPRLKSITLGDMVLISGSKEDGSMLADHNAFMKFFTVHTRLRHVALQQAVGSSTFPSMFNVPYTSLSRLESFQGPLKYLRSLPHPEKLRFLTLTSLHHTVSSFSPTFTALQDFPNLESLSVWVDMSFSGHSSINDDSQVFSSFLLACPTLRHLQILCFTRPGFRVKDFSRALRDAPNLESFTLTKLYKSSDEDMLASATRIIQENPNIQEFTLQYTQERWPTLSGGRLKQTGVYRTQYDDFGNPVAVHAVERKAKALASETSRRFAHKLSAKLPISPAWDKLELGGAGEGDRDPKLASAFASVPDIVMYCNTTMFFWISLGAGVWTASGGRVKESHEAEVSNDADSESFAKPAVEYVNERFDTMIAAAARNVFKLSVARAFAASARQVRGIQTASLPPLPYAYNALEPYISEEIMTLHHQKHHQTYVNGLNAAEEAYAKSNSVKEQIALQAAIKFNGGGHINHSLFWKNLAPANEDGGKLNDGPLKKAIERDFGSVEEFKKQFNTTTAAIQGSGWGWLGFNNKTNKLEVVTTQNQDPLISHVPIIGVDIWEHVSNSLLAYPEPKADAAPLQAFYLQYKNVKPDYLNAIWNVINFKEAEKRFLEASQ